MSHSNPLPKTCIRLLACWWAVSAAAPASAQSQSAKGKPTEIAERFVGHLMKGEYEQAVKAFDEKMAKALPMDRLRQAWESVQASSGELQSLDKPVISQSRGATVVTFPAAFRHAKLNLRITVNADGKIIGFLIQPGGAEAEFKPAPYDKSSRYSEKGVTFGEEPWKIKGKLTRPKSGTDLPAIVLVHGSGPNDEDETIGPNKPFRDLAGGLSSQGVAVLRYQKRTFAYGPQMAEQKTVSAREEVIDDALAALKFLREQNGIDKSRVFLLGHSLGGTLAPAIAAEDKDLAGVIVMAGSPRDFADVIEEQLAYIASLPGPGQDGNRKVLEESREVIAKMRSGEVSGDAKLLGAPLSYWKEISNYSTESPKVLAGLKCRILVIGGGRDYQITRADFDIYGAALKDRKDATLKWYEEMNHLFVRGQGKATPDEYGRAAHIDKTVVKDLAEWIKAETEIPK